jgi:glycosyltransferase involved in cell wall biosynthesis
MELKDASPRIGSGDPATGPGDGVRIALLLPSLAGGGAEACMLRTAEALVRRGLEIDLVLCERKGPLLDQVPPEVPIVELEAAPMLVARAQALAADPAGARAMLRPILLAWKPPHRLPHLPALVRYLRRVRPAALLAALPTPNLLAVWARRLARVPTRIAISERNALSANVGRSAKWRKRHLPALLARAYPLADAIVAVSNGVADDLAAGAGIPRARITTVYNPVVTPGLRAKAEQPVDHPWFRGGAPPVVLGVGALIPQKDFPTLIRAFARLRAERECRLVILGEAPSRERTEAEKAELMKLAASLGVADYLDLPGFVSNPFAYMARAAAFVLSSRHEGLPGVLIQALACGCPAVSTDCPHGPSEILDGGRYGALVPVGDPAALAAAIGAALDDPVPTDLLKSRSQMFTVERAVDRYLDLMLGRPPGVGA